QKALVSQHNELAGQLREHGVERVSEADLHAVSETFSFEDLTHQIDTLRGELLPQATRLAELMEDTVVASADRKKIISYLIALAENEAQEIERPNETMSQIGEGLVRPDGAKQNLQAVMRERLGQPSLEVIAIKRLSGGFSRETYRVNAQLNGSEANYVIRAGAMGGGYLDGLHRSVEEEAPVLDLARRSGVPAPQLHFLETDPDVFGTAFMLMEYSDGAPVGNLVTSMDSLPMALFQNLATVLAQIHALPWQQNIDTFSSTAENKLVSVADGNRSLLEKNWKWSQTAKLRPSISIILAHNWLSRHVPSNPAPAKVVHGDIGFHNMMVDGDDICAVLDWEACDLGSHAWDLVAVEGMFGDRVTWEQFVRWYEDAGGELPSDEELAYNRMLRTFTGNVTCALALEKWFEKKRFSGYLELGLGARPFFHRAFTATARKLWDPDR
nr:phosphotransferase family protein [Acidimicrobiia bacterium]